MCVRCENGHAKRETRKHSGGWLGTFEFEHFSAPHNTPATLDNVHGTGRGIVYNEWGLARFISYISLAVSMGDICETRGRLSLRDLGQFAKRTSTSDPGSCINFAQQTPEMHF